MPKVGAHVSAAISLDLSLDRTQEMGAQCTQIFISPPQQWLQTKHGGEEILRYKQKKEQTSIGPNFIHATYLVNLATQNPEHLQKSIDRLTYALNMAGELGVEGVIFHTGSHGGVGFDQVLGQITKALSDVLKNSPKTPKLPNLILENSAGAGGSIGSKFSELGQILKQVGSERVKVCLDTCHLFAADYNIKSADNLQKTLEEFDQEVGLKNLSVIHGNDTKFDISSGKDRHENIGDGFIGKEGFKNIINHPSLKDIPFILEVPGFSGSGPDKENIDILKSLVDH